MRKIISLICLLLPIWAYAEPTDTAVDHSLNIRSDAPDKHIVVKGDTLWDISGKFFSDPWKWPHIWGLNRETIKNPHWIYPGDIIFLDRTSGTLHIGQPYSSVTEAPGEIAPQKSTPAESNVTKLSPKIREGRSNYDVIPSIPAKAIEPFLSKPLVVEEETLQMSPTLIGAREGRVILGLGDTAFVKDMPSDQGYKWYFYRPGKKFIDPDSGEILGIEAIYLGNGELSKLGDVSTIDVTYSKQEIYQGDRLVTPTPQDIGSYLPRAPESEISAKVISIYGGVAQGGQNSIITLNNGSREGLEVGHVLALYRKGETIQYSGDNYKLPDERYGLAFVFRVFNKVSYALVMQTKLPVQLLDSANTP